MIFVTVGTHEQPFNRLIKYVDLLVKQKDIVEKVVVQAGYSTYIPQNCKFYKMMSFEEMQKAYKNARIIITHGGPSSFIEALQYGKVPIVVPRQYKYHEHINDHQVEFVKLVADRMKNIIPIYEINELKDAINNYDDLIKDIKVKEFSNNIEFNKNLSKIIDKLV
jgi:UDP-N-acetylglucosamine transferase subunit ALG13